MRSRSTLLLGLSILLAVLPALAHHSFATEYDSSKTVTLKGTVMMIDFANPHSWLYINVKDGNMTVSWGVELGPMNDLRLQGWNKDSVKPGTEVAIDGFLAKNGSKTANAKTVKLPDGRILFANGSALPAQTKK